MALRIDNAANQNYELNSEIERLKRFLNSVGLKQITGMQIKQDMPFYTREALLKIKLMEDIQLHSHDILACLKDCQLESDFSDLVTGFSNNTLTATERQSLLKALDFLHAKNKLPAFSSQEYEGLKQCVIEQANHELATQKLFKKQAEIGSLLSPKELGYREKQYLVDEKNKNIQRVIQVLHQQGYLSESMSVEEISQRLLDYVRKNFTYKAENHPDTSTDHWQSIDETYVKKTGDCEDLAIVQASLLMAALKDVKGFSEQQSKNMVVLEAGYLKEKSSKKGHMLVSVNSGKSIFYIDPSMQDSIAIENKNFETLFRFNDIKFEKLKNIDQDFKTASGSDDYNGAYKLGALSRYQQNGHSNLFANKRISANESMDQTIYEALFNSALDVEGLVYGQDWSSIFAMPKQLSTGENDQYMYLYDEVDENLYKEFIAYLANQSGVSIGDELNIQDVQNSYQEMQELMQFLEEANEQANQARLDYQSTQASILDLFRTQSGVSITEGVNTVVLTYTDAAGTEFSETLNVLNLASLSYRNETNDMTEVLKTVNSNTINQAYTNWQNQLGNFVNSLPHGTGRDELSDSLTGLLGQLRSQGSAFHAKKIIAENNQDQFIEAAKNQPGVDESIFQNQSDRIEWYQTIEGDEFNTSKIGELFFLQKYNISADTLKTDLKNLNILDESFKVGSKNNINLYLESALSRYQNIGNDHQFRKDFDLFKRQIKDYLMKRAKKHYILIGEDFKNFLANSERSENTQHEMGKYHFFTVESTKFMEDLIEKESFDAAALNLFSDRISGENSPTEYIQLLKFDGAASKKATGDADYLYENKLDRFLTDLKNKVSRMDAILEIIAQYVTPLEAAVNQVEASVSGDPNKQNKSNSSYFQKIKQSVMQTHQTIISKVSEMQSHVIEAVNSNNSNMKELAEMQIQQYGKIVDESDDLIATLKNMIFAGVTDSMQSTIGFIDVKRAIFKLNLNKIVLENQKHNTSIIEQYFGNILNRLKLEQDELWVGSENNVNGYRFKKRGQNLEKTQEVSVLNPNQDISQTNIASLGVIGNINQANFTSIKDSNLAHFLPFMQRARTAIDGISGKFNVIQEFEKLDGLLNIRGTTTDSSPFKRAHDDISLFPGQEEEDEAFVDFSTKSDYQFVDQASTLIHAQMTNEKYVKSTQDDSDDFFVAGAQSNIEKIYNPNIDDIEASANQSLDLGFLSDILDFIPSGGSDSDVPDKVKSPFLDYNQYVHLNYLEQINQYQRSLSNMLILLDTLHKSHLNAAEGIANAAGSQNVNSLSSDMLSRVTKDRIDQEFSTAKQTLNRLNSQFNDFVGHINSFIEARHEKYIQEKRDFYSKIKTAAMAGVSGLLWGVKSFLFPGVETAVWEFVSQAIGLVERSQNYDLQRENYRYQNPHIMQHYSLMNNNANMFEYNLRRPMDQLDQVNYQLSPTFNRHSPSWYSGFSNQDYQEAYHGSSQQNRPSYVDNYWINRQSLHNGQLGFQSEDFHRRPTVATSINSMMYNTKTGQGINDRYQEQTGRYLLQTMLKFDDQRFRLRQLTGGLNWTRKIYGSGVDKDVANPFLKTMLPRLKYQPGTQKVFEDGGASTLINDTGDGGFAINHFALSQVQQIRYSVQEAMTFKFDLWEQYLKTMSAVVATMLKLFSRTAQVQTTDAETISSVMDNAKNLFDTIMDFESTFHQTLDQELNVLVESLNYNKGINLQISEEFLEIKKSNALMYLGLGASLATFPWVLMGIPPFVIPPVWTSVVLAGHFALKETTEALFVELKNDSVGFSPRHTGYADSQTLKGFLDSLETDMSQINEDFGFGVASPSHDQQAIFLRENDERASIDATNSQFILPQLATQRRSGGNAAQARLGFYNIFQRGNQQDPIEELTNSLNAQTYQAFQALSWTDTSDDPYFLAGNDAPNVQEFNLDIRSRISQNEFENIQTRGGSFSTQSMINNANLRTISASTTPGLSAYDLSTTNANEQVDTTVDSVKRVIEPTTRFGQALDFIGEEVDTSFDARQLDFDKLSKFEDLFSEISIARLKLFNMIKLYLETLTNVTEQVIDKAFGDLGVRRVEMARPVQNIMGYIERYNGMQNAIKDQIIKELEQQITKYNEYLDAQQELLIDKIVNYSMVIVSAVQLVSRRSAVDDEEDVENLVSRMAANTTRKELFKAGIKLAVELIKLNELDEQKRLNTSVQVDIINEEIEKSLDMTDEDQNEEPTPLPGATQRSQDGNTLFGATSSKGSKLNIGVNVSKLPKADSSQDKAMLQERSGLPGLRTKFVDQSGFAKAKIKEKQRQKRENMIMEILSVAMNQLTAASDVAGQGGVTGNSMEVLKKGMAVVQARRSKKLEWAKKKAEKEKDIQNKIVKNIREGLIDFGKKSSKLDLGKNLAETLTIFAKGIAKKIHKNSKEVRRAVAFVRNQMTKMSRYGKKKLGQLNKSSQFSSIKQNAKANILKAVAGAFLFLLKWSFKSAKAVTNKAFKGSQAKSLLIFRALNINDDSKEIPSVPAGNDDALLQDDENLDSVNDAGIETAGLENFVLNQELARANRNVFKEIVNNDVIPFLKWDSGNILKNALDAFQAHLAKTRESKLKKGIKLSKGETGLMGVLQNIIGGLRVGIEFSLAFFNILTSGGGEQSTEAIENFLYAAKSQFGNPEKVRQEKIKKLKKIDEEYKEAERKIMGIGNNKVEPEPTPGAGAAVSSIPTSAGAGAADNQGGNTAVPPLPPGSNAAVPPGPPASAITPTTKKELMDFINDDHHGSAFMFQNIKDIKDRKPSGKFDAGVLKTIVKEVGIKDLTDTQLKELKNQMDSKEADLINIERDKIRKFETFGFGFTFNLFNPFNRNKLKELSKKVEKIFEDINLDGQDTAKLKEALKKHIVPESPNELGHNAAVKLVAEFNEKHPNKQATVKQMKQLVSSENGKKISLISNRFKGTSKTTALARIKVARKKNLKQIRELEQQTVINNLIQSAGKLGERGLFNREKSNSLLELNQAIQKEVANDDAKKKFLLETPLEQIKNKQLRDTAERMRKVKDTEGEEEVESFVKALKPDGKLNQAIQKEVATDEAKIAFLLNKQIDQIKNKQLRDTVERIQEGPEKEVRRFVKELNAAERISEIQKKLENEKRIDSEELAGLGRTEVLKARLKNLETQSRETFNNLSAAERQLMRLFRATFQEEQSPADTFDNDKKEGRFQKSAGTSLNLLDQRNKGSADSDDESDPTPLPASQLARDFIGFSWEKMGLLRKPDLSRNKHQEEKLESIKSQFEMLDKSTQDQIKSGAEQLKTNGILKETTSEFLERIGVIASGADNNKSKEDSEKALNDAIFLENPFKKNDAAVPGIPKNDAAAGADVVPPLPPDNGAAADVVPPLPPDNGAAAAANQDGGAAAAVGAPAVNQTPPGEVSDQADRSNSVSESLSQLGEKLREERARLSEDKDRKSEELVDAQQKLAEARELRKRLKEEGVSKDDQQLNALLSSDTDQVEDPGPARAREDEGVADLGEDVEGPSPDSVPDGADVEEQTQQEVLKGSELAQKEKELKEKIKQLKTSVKEKQKSANEAEKKVTKAEATSRVIMRELIELAFEQESKEDENAQKALLAGIELLVHQKAAGAPNPPGSKSVQNLEPSQLSAPADVSRGDPTSYEPKRVNPTEGNQGSSNSRPKNREIDKKINKIGRKMDVFKDITSDDQDNKIDLESKSKAGQTDQETIKDHVMLHQETTQDSLSEDEIAFIFELLMAAEHNRNEKQLQAGAYFFNQLITIISSKTTNQSAQQLKRLVNFDINQNFVTCVSKAFEQAVIDEDLRLLRYIEPLSAITHYHLNRKLLLRYALNILPNTKKMALCHHLGIKEVLNVIKSSHNPYQQGRIFKALTQLYPLIKEQENLQVMFQPHAKEIFYFLNNKQAQKNHYDLWEMACMYASDYYDHCYTHLSTERLQLSVYKSLQNCREEFNDKFKKLLANSYQNNSDLVQAINQPKQCFEMFLANMPAQLKAIHNQYVKQWGEGSEKLIEKIITTYQHKQVLFNIGKLSLKTLKQQTHLIEFVASLQHVPNSLVYCYKQDPAIFIKACIALDQLKYSKDMTELLNQLPLAIINEITRVKENASRIMDCVFSNNADVWATYLLNNHNHQHNYTLLKSLWCLNKSGFEDAFLKISAKGNAALLLNIRNKNQKIITQKQSSQLFQMLKQYGYVTKKGYASTLISKGVLYQHEQLQKIANLYRINPKILSERLHILQNKLDMWVHYLNKIKHDAENDEDFRVCLDHVVQNLSGHRTRHCQAIESLLKEAVKNVQSINKKELCLEILDLLRPYEAQITSNLGMQDIFKDHPLLWDNTGQLLKKLSQTSLMGAGGALELESAWKYFQQLNAIQWVSKQKNKEIITQIDTQHMKALLQYDSGQFSHPLSVVYNRLNNQDQACLFDCLDQYSDSQRSLILSRLSICNNQMGINYEKAKPLMLSDTELLLSQIENSKHRSYDVLSLLNTYYQQQKSEISLMKMALGLNATQINVYRNEWDMLSTLHKQDENCLRAFLLLLEPGLRQSYLSYLSTHSSKYKDLHEALQEDIKQSYMGTSMQKGPVAVASILFLLRFSSQPDKANILISAMKQLNNQDTILFLSLINELDSQKHAFEKLLFSHQSLISFMSSKIIKLSKKIDARSIKHFLNDSQIKQSIQSAIISNPLLEEQFLQNNQNPDVDNDLQKHHPDIKNNHEVQKDAQKKIKQLVKLSFNTLSNKKGVSFDEVSKFYDSLKETDFALAFCTHFQDYSRKFPVKASYCVYHLLRHSQEKQRHLLNSLRAKINVISANHLQSLDTCINDLLNTPEVKLQKLYTRLKYLYAQDNVLYNNHNL